MAHYVKLGEAAEILRLNPNTLRRYADDGYIDVVRAPSGHRLFDVTSYREPPYRRVRGGPADQELLRASRKSYDPPTTLGDLEAIRQRYRDAQRAMKQFAWGD